MATKIVTKNSSTAGSAPLASDLVQGELAVNVTDKRLYTENASGVIVEVGSNPYNFTANHDGSAKLATTATGIDVTGIALLTGVNQHALTIKSDLGTGTYEIGRNQSTGVLEFKGTETTYNGYLFKGPSSDLMTIDASGSVNINGGTTANTVLTLDSGTPNTYLKITDSNSTNGVFIGATTNDLNFYPNNSLAVTMTASGNVGIGTSSPDSYKLNIYGAGNAGRQLKIEGSSNNGLARFSNTESQDYSIGINNTSFIVYDDTADAYRMVINSSGNVGIGTSSPASKLHLNSSSTTAMTFDSDTSTQQYELGVGYGGVGASSFYLYDNTANASRMVINSSGNVGIGTSSPTDALVVEGNIASPHRIKVSNANASGKAALNFTQGTTVKSWLEFDNASGIFDVWQYTNNDLRFGTNNTERMRINSSGNVGIGTSSPAQALQVNGRIRVSTDGSNGGDIGVDASGLAFSTIGSTQPIIFERNNYTAESMRIDSSGNLLVGTTSTVAGGKISAQAVGSNPAIVAQGASDCFQGRTTQTSGTSYFAYWVYNGSAVGSITSTGSSTAYNTSSDQRLKDNIVDAPSASDDIDAIQVRSFDWKADGSHQKYGMVAQELQTVAPEAVSGDADSEEMMGVDYSKLVPMLIKEIQSLRNRVAQLEGI